MERNAARRRPVASLRPQAGAEADTARPVRGRDMTQLKTVIWPDAPPAKPESDELTLAAKRRAAEIMAGLERGRHRGWSCPPRQLPTVAYPNRATEIVPSLQGSGRAEPATAHRAKLKPRQELP